MRELLKFWAAGRSALILQGCLRLLVLSHCSGGFCAQHLNTGFVLVEYTQDLAPSSSSPIRMKVMLDNAAVLIRRYESKDHGFVCKLFRESLIENWIPAYR